MGGRPLALCPNSGANVHQQEASWGLSFWAQDPLPQRTVPKFLLQDP